MILRLKQAMDIKEHV